MSRSTAVAAGLILCSTVGALPTGKTDVSSHVHTRLSDVKWETGDTYPEALQAVVRWKGLIGGADEGVVPQPDVLMGVLELAPGAIYPGHKHPAPEMYYVTDGTAEWTVGRETFLAAAARVIKRLGVLATASLLGLPSVAATQAVPVRTPERATIVAAAKEVMKKARFCGLVTLGGDGHPQARIVDPLAPEADLTVWIATNPKTRKIEQIKADPRVTLLYFDPSGPGSVTLLARAEVVADSAEKARHWKEEWAAFYADKHRGEDFVLIRCRPIRLELVSHEHGLLNDPDTWRPIAIDLP